VLSLNNCTVHDNFPLPLIEDCLEYLEGRNCFSVIDLKSGYHQVGVEESSIKYTSAIGISQCIRNASFLCPLLCHLMSCIFAISCMDSWILSCPFLRGSVLARRQSCGAVAVCGSQEQYRQLQVRIVTLGKSTPEFKPKRTPL